MHLKKGRNLLTQSSELASQTVIQYFFASLRFVLIFAVIFLPAVISHMCTDDTKYCKHGIDLLFVCDIGALQLIIFQVEGFHEVRICFLQVVSGRFLLTVGRFMSFFAHSRLFEAISCRSKSFLTFCGSFQVDSYLLQVVSGRSAFQEVWYISLLRTSLYFRKE